MNETALKQACVSIGEACDHCDGLGVREVVVAQFLAKLPPVALEDEGQFVLRERRIRVDPVPGRRANDCKRSLGGSDTVQTSAVGVLG